MNLAQSEVNSTTVTSLHNDPSIICPSVPNINSSIIASTSFGGHPSDPTKFHVDRHLLDQVLEFGFEEFIATLAIERTQGVGLEEAVNWIIDHSNQSDLEEQEEINNLMGGKLILFFANIKPFSATTSTSGTSGLNFSFSNAIKAMQPRRTHKMIFVANMGLKMGVGKLAAQVGHATLGVYRVAQKTRAVCFSFNFFKP